MADHFLPRICLANDQVYKPTRCWEDIFEAINNAKHLIYITGWSVYTEITLCRDRQRKVPGYEGLTLGELLKQKADQGVRVNLLVWDDRTSNFLHKVGLMDNHDEDTMLYFENTGVNCVLCPRNPEHLTYFQTATIGTLFTHHQKSVIVDAPVPGHGGYHSGARRIVSFVGGIDLCDGRYDTQYHSLFRTLDNVNEQDFHQANFNGASIESGGPREPWHDIHSRLEGPIAWDVLYNFDQRWRKQAGKDREHLLVRISDLGLNTSVATLDDDPETWNVQLFRSIDSGASFVSVTSCIGCEST
jgi:phospholipase D1/2